MRRPDATLATMDRLPAIQQTLADCRGEIFRRFARAVVSPFWRSLELEGWGQLGPREEPERAALLRDGRHQRAEER